MNYDIVIDKGDGERISLHHDVNLHVWNIRQWVSLLMDLSLYIKNYGWSRLIITPNHPF